MSTSPAASFPELSDELQRYSRYVALVAEQLDALDDADTERLRRLIAERESLAMAVAEDEPESTDSEPGVGRLQDVLRTGLAELEARAEADQRMKERWSRLSDGTLRMARTLAPPRPAGGRYPEPSPLVGKLDVRL